MSSKTNTLFSLSLTVKLILCLFIPLTLDESYYYLWGQYLSLSYFDHPPMVGWLMALSSGFKEISESAIRWPFIILSHATLFIWYHILKDELSSKKIRLFLLTALLNPLWGWGAFIATPDIPLVFFWSLALFFTKKLIKSANPMDYLGLGLSLGLGFLSKYQIVLFIPALFIFLWQQNLFHRLFTRKSLLTISAGLLACAPVIIWNYQHEWASFIFQWEHGMASKHWSWKEPINYILSQFFIIFPTFLIFIFVKAKGWKSHWLTPFALFPFAFFLYSSFKGRVEGNWVIMAFPALYALSYLFTNDLKIHFLKKTNTLWAALFTLAFTFLIFHESLPSVKTKITEYKKYDEVLAFAENSELPTVGYSYQLAGYLSFKTNQLVCKLHVWGRLDHFDYMDECQSLPEHFHFITHGLFVPYISFDKFNLEKLNVIKLDDTHSAVELRRK